MYIKFIGSGAAGNKALISAIECSAVDRKSCILLNTTEKDVNIAYRDIFKQIGNSLKGCGKERTIAKNILFSALKDGSFDIEAFCKEGNPDMIVLVSSTSGGSGSGITTLLAKYIKDVVGINVHVFGFTGFEADGRELQNTIEFFQDIEDTFGVEAISNKKFLGDGNNIIKAEEAANEEFCKRMRILQGLDIRDSVQNIDDTDLYKLATTEGFMNIEHIQLPKIKNSQIFEGAIVAAMDDTKTLETSNGCHRLGVIINCKDKNALQYIDTNMTTMRERWGTPYESFLHIQHDENQEDYIDIIMGGMKLPSDELKEAYDRYKKMSASVNKEADDFFSTVGGFRGDAADAMFNMKQKSKQIAKNDFFSKLESQ